MNGNDLNKMKKENPYKDYLPENRFNNNNSNRSQKSEKIAKIGLFPFYLLVIFVIVAGVFWFNGNSFFTIKKRLYNMNLAETIDLDTVYSSEKVEWLSDDENVVIENNVVTAVTSGDAYVYAKEGNTQVSDAKLNVLTGNEAIRLDSHSLATRVGDKQSISVTRNLNAYKEKDYETSPKERMIDFFRRISSAFIRNNFFINHYFIQNNIGFLGLNVSTLQFLDTDIDDTLNIDGEQNLEYISSNEKVAVVDKDGNVTTIAPGVAEIIVRDEEGNEDHTVITVVEDDITLYSEEYTLYVGGEASVEYNLVSNTYNTSDVKWSSNNPSVVSIDNDGKIVALAVGSAEVVVSVGNVSKKIKVNVKENIVLPTDIKLSSDNVSVKVGADKQINATVIPNNATDTSLTWSSDDVNIAIVRDGVIIGKREGSTIVTVTTSNGIKKQINVMVSKKNLLPESINFVSSTLDMTVGSLKNLSELLSPSNIIDKNLLITYNKDYLSIDENYSIKALKKGTTVLNVETVNHMKASLTINIVDATVSLDSIRISDEDLKLAVGDSKLLNVLFTPLNASNKKVSWNSSNEAVASVDSEGNVKAISVGEAIITVVSIDNPSIKSSISITVVDTVFDCTVTLNTDGGNIEKSEFTVKKGSNFEIDSYIPEKAGYEFKGWYTDKKEGEEVKGKVVIKTDVVYYAHWSVNTYVVTLNNQGAKDKGTEKFYYQFGVGVKKSTYMVYYYEDIDLETPLKNGAQISTPLKNGYDFGGYFSEKDGQGVQYIKGNGTFINGLYKNVSQNVTLYAKWIKKSTRVVLDNDNATTTGTTEIYYQYNESRKINNKRVHYFGDSLLTSGITSSFSDRIEVPTKKNYVFGGYFSERNGGGVQYIKGNGTFINGLYKSVGEDTVLYAKWIADTCTVTLDNGDALKSGTEKFYYKFKSSKKVSDKSIHYFGNYLLNNGITSSFSDRIEVPIKDGYTFGGYFSERNGGGVQYIKENGTFINQLYAKVNTDITLYAKWTGVCYKSYSKTGRQVIQTLNESSFTRLFRTENGDIKHSDEKEINGLQGYAYWNGHHIFGKHLDVKQGGIVQQSYNAIVSYNDRGKIEKKYTVLDYDINSSSLPSYFDAWGVESNRIFGHMNGFTEKNGVVYFASMDGLHNYSFSVKDFLNTGRVNFTKKNGKVDANALGIPTNISFSKSGIPIINGKGNPVGKTISALAYDSSNDLFYINISGSIYVYNYNTKSFIRKIKRISDQDTTQDIGAYNGLIFAIDDRYKETKGTEEARYAYVDIYQSATGAYIGSWKIGITGELEGIDYYGSTNRFVFGLNRDKGNEIYVSKNNVIKIERTECN